MRDIFYTWDTANNSISYVPSLKLMLVIFQQFYRLIADESFLNKSNFNTKLKSHHFRINCVLDILQIPNYDALKLLLQK